jgi:hypothetical protein
MIYRVIWPSWSFVERHEEYEASVHGKMEKLVHAMGLKLPAFSA